MKRACNWLCALVLLLVNPAYTIAQGFLRQEGEGIEATFFAGKVLKHSPKFNLPIPDLSTGVDINMVWKTKGNKDWHQRRNYPTVGLAFAYTSYGIDSAYGKCFALYPNITIPIINKGKFSWVVRIGDGIAFVTRKFGRIPIQDTINGAIGSTINDYASFYTHFRYAVNKHWDVQAGLNFSHISDASFRKPNLGINMYGWNVGIRYFPVSSTPKLIHNKLPKLSNRWLMQLRTTLSFNSMEAPNGPLYPVYNGTAFVSKRWLSKNKVFAGVDYTWYPGVYAFQRAYDINAGRETANSYKTSYFIGNEFLIGRVGVVIQVGKYVQTSYINPAGVYEKLGGNLYLIQREKGALKELCLTGLLKTHGSVAELTEFGLGVGF